MEFDATLTEQDVIRFNLYHTFSRFFTWFTMALGVVALIFAAVFSHRISGTLTAIYILLGLFLLIYIPLNPVLMARHRMKVTPSMREPLHYQIDEAGVAVSREGESASLSWEKFYRVVFRETAVYLYSSRIYAYVIPKAALADGKEEELKTFVTSHLERRRIKGL